MSSAGDFGRALVKRHGVVVMLTHWGIALSGLLLLMSGIFQMPSAARYKITSIPGFWLSGDFYITLKMHYIASVIFVALVVFHIVYHLILREFSMVPRMGDMSESVKVIKTFITNEPEPPFGKYLPEQRLAYVAIAIPVIMLIISGLVKTWKNLYAPDIDRSLILWMTWIHNIGFMLFFMTIIGHVAALIIKPNRPMLRGMITGKVSESYAKHRHPLWYDEIKNSK